MDCAVRKEATHPQEAFLSVASYYIWMSLTFCGRDGPCEELDLSQPGQIWVAAAPSSRQHGTLSAASWTRLASKAGVFPLG